VTRGRNVKVFKNLTKSINEVTVIAFHYEKAKNKIASPPNEYNFAKWKMEPWINQDDQI